MRRSIISLLGVAWCVGTWILPGCAPVAVTEVERQQQEEEERFRVKISYDPAAPQAISGFLHLGQVHSVTMGSAGMALGAGSPQDLNLLIDALNELTSIRTSFATSISYSDPRLFDLPVIIPQSPPNEVEMEQLTRYLMKGGFILDLDIGFDVYREGLEKYGGLVWGSDAWVEYLETDHPIFAAFFEIQGGIPQSAPRSSQREWSDRLRGLFVGGRLAGVQFGVREPPMNTNPNARGANWLPSKEEIEEEILERNRDREGDFRRQQMAVNIVVYALTQEGSLARGSGGSGQLPAGVDGR